MSGSGEEKRDRLCREIQEQRGQWVSLFSIGKCLQSMDFCKTCGNSVKFLKYTFAFTSSTNISDILQTGTVICETLQTCQNQILEILLHVL